MSYTTYNSATGEIYTTTFGDDVSVMSTIGDQTYIEGAYNSQQYYIDIETKQAVLKGDKPGTNYTWNYNTKSWQANTDQDAIDARNQRELLFTAVDRVNPIWYASLTQEQQTELATYRTALLAVPQQSGFPTAIEWPIKPSWL
jgi:hypothetical protein